MPSTWSKMLSNNTATIAPVASLDKAPVIYPREVRLLALETRGLSPNTSAIYPREVRLLALETRGLSPNTSARRASGGVLRFFGCLSHWLRWLQVPIDWGQSIYQFTTRGKFCLRTLTKR